MILNYLSICDQEGQTALIAACARELSTLAIALIDKGASIDAADKVIIFIIIDFISKTIFAHIYNFVIFCICY